MDMATLSTTIVALLAPYLVEAGKAAAQKTGETIADAAPKVYQAVRARFAQKPAAADALADLEKIPSDEDLQAAVRVQLKKLLAEDPAFAQQLQQLLATAQSATISDITNVIGDGTVVKGNDNTVVGSKGVYIGGNVQGSINTGDR